MRIAPRTPPRYDFKALQAYAASLRLWFASCATWLLDLAAACLPRAQARVLRLEFRKHLRAEARILKALVFLHFHRKHPPRRVNGPRHSIRPPNLYAGFARKTLRGSMLRRFTRGAFKDLHRGDDDARLAGLASVLENLERYANHIARHAARPFKLASLTPARPPARDLPSNAPPATPGVCDSS